MPKSAEKTNTERTPIAGQAPDLAHLVDEEGPRLLAFLRRTCGDGSDAEDVAQQAFLAATRSFDQLESAASARAWLYAIARHTCQRMHRRRAGAPRFFEPLESLDELTPRPAATVPELPQGVGDPHAERLRTEARELVERGVAQLPPAFRQVLVLADLAELTTAEIASVLGLLEATVKTRLHRARLKLRKILAEGLPQRSAPPPSHSRRVCLDLLQAKLEAMDRRVPFSYSDDALCARCRTLLGTIDLAGAACLSLRGERLDPELRRRILAAAAES